MALSLATARLLRRSCTSDILPLAAALSKGGSFTPVHKNSSTAPAPQDQGNLFGVDREGKYSPFQASFHKPAS